MIAGREPAALHAMTLAIYTFNAFVAISFKR